MDGYFTSWNVKNAQKIARGETTDKFRSRWRNYNDNHRIKFKNG